MTVVNKNGYLIKVKERQMNSKRKDHSYHKKARGDPTIFLVKARTNIKRNEEGEEIYVPQSRGVVDLRNVYFPPHLVGKRVRFSVEVVQDPKEKRSPSLTYFGKLHGGENDGKE